MLKYFVLFRLTLYDMSCLLYSIMVVVVSVSVVVIIFIIRGLSTGMSESIGPSDLVA